MKTIHTEGITYIEPVPGGTAEWYCGVSREHGDLFEAEEIFRDGRPVVGNTLCLIHYPDGAVFRPTPKKAGTYSDTPVFFENAIYFPTIDFADHRILIGRFDCGTHEVSLTKMLPLDRVKDCYNLQLHTAPLCLTRQGGADCLFEIIWPERVRFARDPHETFFLRDGEKLYFNKWYEEGEGADYRYWEETVVRSLSGEILEILPGDVRLMPDGELWHLV